MMKSVDRSFIKRIIICIAALFLMGAVPSFATPDEITEDGSTGFTVLPAVDVDYNEVPKLDAKSAVIMDLGSGGILYEKKADSVREPASLTKILTALIVLENMDLDEEVTIREDIEIEGSIIGLVPGEKLTVEELLYGMMLESGNDAAEALAIACDGGIGEFAEHMNERASECGATNSNFKNPNGLNEDPSRINKTTARDMAYISAEAMDNEKFREIVSTRKYTIPATNKSDARELRNTNLCLWAKSMTVEIDGKETPLKYEGCNGIKTGMTSDAGHCFIGSAERDGTKFLVLSMGAEEDLQRFTDAIKLWDFAFDKFGTYTVISAGESAGLQRVERGSVRKVKLVAKNDLTITVDKDSREDPGITRELFLYEEKLAAPVKKDTVVGNVVAIDTNGRIVGEQKIYTAENVAEGGPLSYVGIEDREAPFVIGGAGLLLLIIIIVAIAKKVGRKKDKRIKQDDMRSQLVKMRMAGEGMTPMEWSELTGDPKETPIPQGPSRLTDEEFEELNAPEITRSNKTGGEASRPETVDPNKPMRHGRLTQQELEDLLAGKMIGGETENKEEGSGRRGRRRRRKK